MYACMCLRIFLLGNNNTSPLQLRLIGGSNKQQGGLEILYYGVWGYVCYRPFSLNSANVACRRLGFPGAVSYKQWFSYHLPATIWLSDVQCFGNETGLEQCSHLGFGNYGYCGEYAEVLCIGMYVYSLITL